MPEYFSLPSVEDWDLWDAATCLQSITFVLSRQGLLEAMPDHLVDPYTSLFNGVARRVQKVTGDTINPNDALEFTQYLASWQSFN